MNRRQRFFGGVATDFSLLVITSIFSFLVVPWYLAYVRPEEYGVWSTAFEAANMLALVLASFDLWLIRQLSTQQQDPSQAQAALGLGARLLGLTLLGTGLLLGIGYGVWPQVMERFTKGAGSDLLLLLLGWLVLSAWGQYLLAVLMGQNRMALANLFAGLAKLGYLLVPLAYLQGGWGLESFGWAYLTVALVLLLVQLAACWPSLANWLRAPHPTALPLSQGLGLLGQNLISKLGINFYFYANIFLIAQALGPLAVAMYAISSKLINLSRFLIPRIIVVGFPSFAALLAQGERDKLKQVLLLLYRFSLRGGLWIGGLVAALNSVFVSHWVGAELNAGLAFSLIGGGLVLKEAVSPIFAQVYFANPQVRRTGWISLCEWCLHLLLAWWWLRHWGLAGALAAALTTTGLISLGYFVGQCQKLVGFTWGELLQSSLPVLLKSLPSLGLFALAALQLQDHFAWSALAGWVLAAGLANLLVFEGRHLWDLRGLGLRETVKEIIARS